ncbi:replicative DNA helicase [Helicobacter salomonis]|uniref:replicative DNA helicase n=1 Tax=Helicobacter salomonis TaxID=56878 RepID=UPI0013155FA9|nr:DnaB-like helicase C-terminal domain-containing protein [Helicobacter salomonis]
MKSPKSHQNNSQTTEYQSFRLSAIREYEQIVLAHFLEIATKKEEIEQYEMIAEDFNHPHHSQIFQMLIDLHNQGLPANAQTILKSLDKNAEKESLMLVMASAPIVNIAPYVKAIKEAKAHTEIRKLSIDLHADSSNALECDPLKDPMSSIAKARSELDNIEQRITPTFFEHSAQIVQNALQEMRAIEQDRSAHMVRTGFEGLDNLIGGFKNGELVIIGARPSTGKSAFMLSLALNALNQCPQRAVGIVSLEMSKNELMFRIFSMLSGVPLSLIRFGKCLKEDHALIEAHTQKISTLPLFIDDHNNDIHTIRAKAHKLVREQNLQLLIIDYIHIIKMDAPLDKATAAIGALSSALKHLAKELNIPIVALSQLNRYLDHRDNKKPILADLRHSGELEQDADLVLFLHRESVYEKARIESEYQKLLVKDKEKAEDYLKEKSLEQIRAREQRDGCDEVEVIVAKSRQGQIGEVRLWFKPYCTAFCDPYDGDDLF